MSEESKYKTREIAADIIAGIMAVKESCLLEGCEPSETKRYLQNFLDAEINCIPDSELAKRVALMSKNPDTMHQKDDKPDVHPGQILGYFITN